MRFEIKTGGIAAILVGVAALSFAVFLLGLLAGYDVGRESQTSAAQVATAYPVGAPPDSATNSAPAPAAVPSPARQVGSAAVAPTPMAVKATAPVASNAPIAPLASAGIVTPKHSKPAARATPSDDDDDYPEPIPNASEAPPPTGRVTAPTRRATAEDDTDTTDNDAEVDAPAPVRTPRAAPTEVASAHPPQPSESPSQPRHKPFNIQIEAAMDSNSANQMSQRLRALGYQSHLVPAHLNGQTWYKIVIGPYPSQAAASAAQTEMRAKYNNVYGSRTANASGTAN
jgi:septal ring-binding cell division protein DamX